MVQHQMLVVLVPHYLLLQLMRKKQQKLLLQPPLRHLLHLQQKLLQLVRHREVTILEMQQGWMPTASWPCTTASALPLESRCTSGTTRSPPTPRLGSIIWRQERQAASSSTVPSCQGINKSKNALLGMRIQPRPLQ